MASSGASSERLEVGMSARNTATAGMRRSANSGGNAKPASRISADSGPLSQAVSAGAGSPAPSHCWASSSKPACTP
ncbi:hypothetical protein D3C85_1476090 [compost metagenome]